MNKNRSIRAAPIAILFFSAIGLSGCGVKGDPLPPLTPAELSRGRPAPNPMFAPAPQPTGVQAKPK